VATPHDGEVRAPHPSREVLAGLARALRLTDAEHDHLHRLAGVEPAPPPGPPRVVRQSILDLPERLPQAAAIVTSATYEVLPWNDLVCALMEDFSALSPRDRNLARRAFLGPHPARQTPLRSLRRRRIRPHLRPSSAHRRHPLPRRSGDCRADSGTPLWQCRVRPAVGGPRRVRMAHIVQDVLASGGRPSDRELRRSRHRGP
jgi:hypothetical protein